MPIQGLQTTVQIPLTRTNTLQTYRNGAAANDYVFPTPPEPGRPSVPHDRVVKADLTAAGIPHYNEHEAPYGMHSLRKGFCTTLAESGAGEMLGAKLMRHSDPRITAKVYNKARLKPLAEAVAQVPRLTAVTTKVVSVAAKTTTAALDIPMNGRQTDTVASPAILRNQPTCPPPGLPPPSFAGLRRCLRVRGGPVT